MSIITQDEFPSVESLIKKGKALKNPLSVGVAHPLLMSCNSKVIATGTCFFYSHNKKLYLITAGHNITGTNPETSEVMGIPDKLGVMIYKTKNDCLAGWETHEVHLEYTTQPVWLQHPTHGLKVDVVAIPWKQPAHDDLIKPINEMSFSEDVPIEVGMGLFILGYPHGYSCYPHLAPIWKLGTLATEFAFDINRLPLVYVDTATAKGMSGAPVIANLVGGYIPEAKEKDIRNYVLGTGRKFLGIYTGRITDEKTADVSSDIFNAQLGMVWKKVVIEEILNQ